MLEVFKNKGISKYLDLLIISTIAIWQYLLVNWFVPELLMLSVAIMVSTLSVVIALVFDNYILKVNTYEEIITNKNIAYAIYFVGITTIIAFSFAFSFFTYFTYTIAK